MNIFNTSLWSCQITPLTLLVWVAFLCIVCTVRMFRSFCFKTNKNLMKQEVMMSCEGSSVNQELVAELVKRLPMKLRVSVRTEVLTLALQEGYLSVTDDGHWVWRLESKTLLAYFCGRMWCGDTPLYSKRARGYIWQSGGVRFPKKDLVALFGVRNLRTLREQRYMGLLPAGWELVEKMFEK